MNTNNLKKFAQQTRQKLIEQVTAKLEIALETDSATLREQAAKVKKLRAAIDATSKAAVIDRVAYTWFNRLVALRFMDVNNYQPLQVRIITPPDNFILPELLNDAQQHTIPNDLQVDTAPLYDLLDRKTPSADPESEVYRTLLVAACNHLHTTFPFLFERINDYTELLLPDDLLSEFSVIYDIRKGMSVTDCQEVEVIGWLYQFYISERKDEVFASKSKVAKEDIPAATQLFTPRWIVEYMVQNTVGKLWLQNKPNSKLRDDMPYYIESASAEPEDSEDYLKIDSVEELTLLDQACGSGHILVYGFDLLYKIYQEEGYSDSEIPKLILEKNLYGFEIDERAAQLANFALMMKAREHYRRIFRKEIVPNIMQFEDLALNEVEVISVFERLKITVTDDLKHDLDLMRQATNFGSLIQPQTDVASLEKVQEILLNNENTTDVFLQAHILELKKTINTLLLLGRKYHCVVDNPPYMGSGNMNAPLSSFVKKNYKNSKADLMACFMEAGLAALQPKGYLGMINQHSWMFLNTYSSLRLSIISNFLIESMLHLGSRAFPGIGGEVVQSTSFIIKQDTPKYKGTYIKLTSFESSFEKEQNFKRILKDENLTHYFMQNQTSFTLLPGRVMGYWLSKVMIDIFTSKDSLGDISILRQGMATTDNQRFLRFWHEILYNQIGFNLSKESALNSGLSWFPFNKGGSYRKWYGNNEYVVNYAKNGSDLIELVKSKYPKISDPEFVIKNRGNYFQEGITWSALSSGVISFRFSPEGFIFDATGQMLFSENAKTIMAMMNTKVATPFLEAMTPTLHFNLGYVSKVPFIENNAPINVNYFINVAKTEWDSRETSWDFQKNQLLLHRGQDLEESYDYYCQYWRTQFFKLHKNEEELNRQFIDIYGLQDELTPDVPLTDITLLKEEADIVNGDLVFNKKEIIKQLISYAVGCMFGRYSLDKAGLILANAGETLDDYFQQTGTTEATASFLPDDDNIIPILNDKWFSDDITGRFQAFLKTAFGAQDYSKNLAFVEEALGKDLRKYFLKDFYADHIKRYKKRPIYWLFASPSGAFSALIYLHRYTPDTLNLMLTNYLEELREKLRIRSEALQRTKETGSPKEQIQAAKEIDQIKKQLVELQEYERNDLRPFANDRIKLDLDNGVLVNYNKFGKAIKAVKGLNDAKTKQKVKGFDWIDGEEIR